MLLSTRRLDHISRTTCSFGRRSRSRSRPDPGAGRRTIQPTHCLRARIDATAHRGRLLRRSAALSASRLRATSNTLQQALLQPHGEPPAAAERRPAAAHATPQPRCSGPRADRCRCSPRPPPGAICGSIRISGARCFACAAAHPTATSGRPMSRVGASAHGRICDAAAQAPEAARGSPPPTTTAASWGDPRLYPHLRRALRHMRRGTSHSDHMAVHEPRRRVCPWPHLRRRSRGARDRARIAATDHHGRLMGRSAALAASPARAAPDAPRHTPLRLRGEPPAASARRPVAASAMPQPRRPTPRADRRRRPPRRPPRATPAAIGICGARCVQRAAARPAATARRASSRVGASAAAAPAMPQPRRPRPRADRRDRPPRPPHGAIRGSGRISGALCVECAAAGPTATARRATMRGRASVRCSSCHAAAEVTRGSTPLLTTAASWGDPRVQPHLRRAMRRMRRGTHCCDRTASRQPRPRVGPLSSCHAAAEPRADRRHRSPRPPHGAIRGSIGISDARRIQRAAVHSAATASRATSRGRRSAPGSAPCRPQMRLSDRPRAQRRRGWF